MQTKITIRQLHTYWEGYTSVNTSVKKLALKNPDAKMWDMKYAKKANLDKNQTVVGTGTENKQAQSF